jgi:hypothetical protein
MLGKLLDDIADDNELASGTARLLSLVFLLIAAVLSLLEYTRPVTGWTWDWVPSYVWPWPHGHKVQHVNFRPDFINGLIALALVAPLYMRGLLKWKRSLYSIISFSLILLVFASFVTMALGGGGTNNSVIRGSLLSAVVLSWLGIRSVAGLSWLLALGTGVYSVNVNSIAMGLPGCVYVASATLGLLLHSGLHPGDLVQGLMVEYWPATRRAIEASRSDVGALGDGMGNLARTTSRIGLPGR